MAHSKPADWAAGLPPGLSQDVLFKQWWDARMVRGEVDFRFPEAQQAYANVEAERHVQDIERQAKDKALEEQRTTQRRRLGPKGFGATVLTSPLGISGPAPGQMTSLLGMAG